MIKRKYTEEGQEKNFIKNSELMSIRNFIDNPMSYKENIEKQKQTIRINGGRTLERNSNWKGGKKISGYHLNKEKEGYIYIKSYDTPNRNKQNYVPEHHLVMKKHIGRYLTPEEVVHHIDGNRKNNSIENLHLFKNKSEHQKYHTMLRRTIIEELGLDFQNNIGQISI